MTDKQPAGARAVAAAAADVVMLREREKDVLLTYDDELDVHPAMLPLVQLMERAAELPSDVQVCRLCTARDSLLLYGMFQTDLSAPYNSPISTHVCGTWQVVQNTSKLGCICVLLMASVIINVEQ